MTTDQSEALAAAEAAVAAAHAEVDRLRTKLAAEHAASVAEPTGPRLLTWEDGLEAARRRHPGRTRSAQAAGTDAGTDDAQPADITSPADMPAWRVPVRRLVAAVRPVAAEARQREHPRRAAQRPADCRCAARGERHRGTFG